MPLPPVPAMSGMSSGPLSPPEAEGLVLTGITVTVFPGGSSWLSAGTAAAGWAAGLGAETSAITGPAVGAERTGSATLVVAW
jgi:hypothetical protein